MTNRNKMHNESRSEQSNNPTKSKWQFSTLSVTLTTASLGCKYVIRHCESKQMTQWMTHVRSNIAKEQSKFPYTLNQTFKVQWPLEKINYLSEAVWSHSIRTRQGTTQTFERFKARHNTMQHAMSRQNTVQHVTARHNTNTRTRQGTTQHSVTGLGTT